MAKDFNCPRAFLPLLWDRAVFMNKRVMKTGKEGCAYPDSLNLENFYKPHAEKEHILWRCLSFRQLLVILGIKTLWHDLGSCGKDSG